MHEDDTLDPALATIVAIARQPAPLGAAARARVVLAVQAEMAHARRARRSPVSWILEPRSLRVSPLAGLAVAAGLVGIGLALGLAGRARTLLAPDTPAAAATAAGAAATPRAVPVAATGTPARVKFVFVAPGASQVTVVGDFNDWNPTAHPMERTPTGGTWTVTVPLDAGRHEYSFVVDGKHWMPDPTAPLAPNDGFGGANSVLLVSGSTS